MEILKRSSLALAIFIAVGTLLGGAAVALAEGDPIGTQLSVDAPAAATFGEPARLVALLRDEAGKPVEKATVRFYSPVSFLAGAGGLMRLDEGITDADGVATIHYAPTQTTEIRIVAKFDGDTRYAASQADMLLPVNGNHQLYEAEAGIRVPFVGKWWLVAVLSLIWGLYFLVVNLVLRVALARD